MKQKQTERKKRKEKKNRNEFHKGRGPDVATLTKCTDRGFFIEYGKWAL